MDPLSQTEFEVTLLSNGSMNIYPKNTLACFTNLLSEPLLLTEGKWGVSLVDIVYSGSIMNVRKTRVFHVAFPVPWDADGKEITPRTPLEMAFLGQGIGWINAYKREKYLYGGLYPNVDSIVDSVQKLTDTEFNVTVDIGRMATTKVQTADLFHFDPI